jgi:hypothetical protein
MRLYLELIEVVPTGTVEGDFIRIDVTGWSDEDVRLAAELLREHAKVYEHYRLQRHYCRHDEGEACEAEVLEER